MFMPDLNESRTQFTTAILTHADNTTEQDTLELTTLKNNVRITMDVSSFVQEFTIRTFDKTDGVNYRQLEAKVFPTDYDTGAAAIVVILDGGGQDMKFTLQSTITEGAVRSPPITRRETTRN